MIGGRGGGTQNNKKAPNQTKEQKKKNQNQLQLLLPVEMYRNLLQPQYIRIWTPSILNYFDLS